MYSGSAFNDESNKILYKKTTRANQNFAGSTASRLSHSGFVSSCDTSVDNDGHSLTYSASSSQAGESTDSSTDILAFEETERRLKNEQFQHRREMEMVKSFSVDGNSPKTARNSFYGFGSKDLRNLKQFHNAPVFHRQSSAASESLNYSEVSDAESYLIGQPSDSRHDPHHGQILHQSPTPPSTSRKSSSTPSQQRPKTTSSPSIVSDFISVNSGATPPPRHAKKLSSGEAEVWYQKWWMCGFTDALNLNQP
jgi:hypothetical protein